jgi:hypothetical protein
MASSTSKPRTAARTPAQHSTSGVMSSMVGIVERAATPSGAARLTPQRLGCERDARRSREGSEGVGAAPSTMASMAETEDDGRSPSTSCGDITHGVDGSFALEGLDMVQRPGEDDGTFMKRACCWCRAQAATAAAAAAKGIIHGVGTPGDAAFNDMQMHCGGIWLHASQYSLCIKGGRSYALRSARPCLGAAWFRPIALQSPVPRSTHVKHTCRPIAGARATITEAFRCFRRMPSSQHVG